MTSGKRLFRSSASGRIGGVCAGLAEYLEADVTFIRLAWVVLSIVPGVFVGGFLAYLGAWIVMPDSSAPGTTGDASTKRLTRSATDRKIAGVCAGLADYVNVDPTIVRVVWIVLTVVPGVIVLGIAAYLVAWFIMPGTPVPRRLATTPAA